MEEPNDMEGDIENAVVVSDTTAVEEEHATHTQQSEDASTSTALVSATDRAAQQPPPTHPEAPPTTTTTGDDTDVLLQVNDTHEDNINVETALGGDVTLELPSEEQAATHTQQGGDASTTLVAATNEITQTPPPTTLQEPATTTPASKDDTKVLLHVNDDGEENNNMETTHRLPAGGVDTENPSTTTAAPSIVEKEPAVLPRAESTRNGREDANATTNPQPKGTPRDVVEDSLQTAAPSEVVQATLPPPADATQDEKDVDNKEVSSEHNDAKVVTKNAEPLKANDDGTSICTTTVVAEKEVKQTTTERKDDEQELSSQHDDAVATKDAETFKANDTASGIAAAPVAEKDENKQTIQSTTKPPEALPPPADTTKDRDIGSLGITTLVSETEMLPTTTGRKDDEQGVSSKNDDTVATKDAATLNANDATAATIVASPVNEKDENKQTMQSSTKRRGNDEDATTTNQGPQDTDGAIASLEKEQVGKYFVVPARPQLYFETAVLFFGMQDVELALTAVPSHRSMGIKKCFSIPRGHYQQCSSLEKALEYLGLPNNEGFSISADDSTFKESGSCFAVRPRPGLYFDKPVIFKSLQDLDYALNAIPIQRNLGKIDLQPKTTSLPSGHVLEFRNLGRAFDYVKNAHRQSTPVPSDAGKEDGTSTTAKSSADTSRSFAAAPATENDENKQTIRSTTKPPEALPPPANTTKDKDIDNWGVSSEHIDAEVVTKSVETLKAKDTAASTTKLVAEKERKQTITGRKDDEQGVSSQHNDTVATNDAATLKANDTAAPTIASPVNEKDENKQKMQSRTKRRGNDEDATTTSQGPQDTDGVMTSLENKEQVGKYFVVPARPQLYFETAVLFFGMQDVKLALSAIPSHRSMGIKKCFSIPRGHYQHCSSLQKALEYLGLPNNEGSISADDIAFKESGSCFAVRPRPGLYFDKPVIFKSLQDLDYALNAIPIQRNLGKINLQPKTTSLPSGHVLEFHHLGRAFDYVKNAHRQSTPVPSDAGKEDGTSTTAKSSADTSRSRAPLGVKTGRALESSAAAVQASTKQASKPAADNVDTTKNTDITVAPASRALLGVNANQGGAFSTAPSAVETAKKTSMAQLGTKPKYQRHPSRANPSVNPVPTTPRKGNAASSTPDTAAAIRTTTAVTAKPPPPQATTTSSSQPRPTAPRKDNAASSTTAAAAAPTTTATAKMPPPTTTASPSKPTKAKRSYQPHWSRVHKIKNNQSRGVKYYVVHSGFYFQEPVIFFSMTDLQSSVDAVQRVLGITTEPSQKTSMIPKSQYQEFDTLRDALKYASDNANRNPINPFRGHTPNIGNDDNFQRTATTTLRGKRKAIASNINENAVNAAKKFKTTEQTQRAASSSTSNSMKAMLPPHPLPKDVPLPGRLNENPKQRTASTQASGTNKKPPPVVPINSDFAGADNAQGLMASKQQTQSVTTASKKRKQRSPVRDDPVLAGRVAENLRRLTASMADTANGDDDDDNEMTNSSTKNRGRKAPPSSTSDNDNNHNKRATTKRTATSTATAAATAKPPPQQRSQKANQPTYNNTMPAATNPMTYGTPQAQQQNLTLPHQSQNGAGNNNAANNWNNAQPAMMNQLANAYYQAQSFANQLMSVNARMVAVQQQQQADDWAGQQFDQMFDGYIEKLKTYRAKHGNLDLPSTKNYASLKEWILQQRKNYADSKAGRPSPLKLKHFIALADLGLDMTKAEAPQEKTKKVADMGPAEIAQRKQIRFDEVFEKHLHALKAYKDEHGNVNVKGTSVLGRHLAKLRRHYDDLKRGDPSPLKAEHIAAMTDLGVSLANKNEQKADKRQKLFNECFQERLKELKDYKAEHGNVNVDNKSELGKHITKLRRHYNDLKKGNPSPLKAEHIVAMTDLGVSLVNEEKMIEAEKLELFNKLFLQRLEELKAYKAEHGDVNVPTNSPLEQWICRTRQQYRHLIAGSPKTGGLQMEHVEALKDLGVDLKPFKMPRIEANAEFEQIRFDYQFDRKIEQIKAYKKEHGHVDFPVNTMLRNWIWQQRRYFTDLRAGKPSPLQTKHIVTLTNLGFAMTSKHSKPKVQDTINKYCQFVKKHGRHPKLFAPDSEEARLAQAGTRWRQKYNLAHGGLEGDWIGRKLPPLSQAYIDALNEVNFKWEYKIKPVPVKKRARPLPWLTRLEHLKAYKAKHGHTEVPKRHPKLGKWVLRQRQEYKKMVEGKKHVMPMDRFRLLSEIGFRFKQAGSGHSRTRYVDNGSSGYDTTDSEDEVDRRGRPRKDKVVKKKTTATSSDSSEEESEEESDNETDEEDTEDTQRVVRGGRPHSSKDLGRMQRTEWAARYNQAAVVGNAGAGNAGAARTGRNDSSVRNQTSTEWSIRNLLNF